MLLAGEAMSLGVDLVVEAAVQFFRNPGVPQGNRDFSIETAIRWYENEYPNIRDSIEEIGHRFTLETTFPPEVTEEMKKSLTLMMISTEVSMRILKILRSGIKFAITGAMVIKVAVCQMPLEILTGIQNSILSHLQ